MSGVKAVWARIQRTRAYGAWKRYGDARGDLLAAGVGYFAFFSAFPAIALMFTAVGFFLRGRPDLIDTIATALNSALPNFVKTPTTPNGVISLGAPDAGALTVTGLVALLMMILSGLGWIGALRTGIRAIFGAPGSPGNFLTDKLGDLGVFLGLGVGIAASAVLSSTVGGVAQNVASWVGLPNQQALVTVAGLLVGAAIDTVLMVLLLRVLSGVALPWRDVRNGAIVGAVGLTLLKYFAGFLVGQATKNPLFASIAVVVGLLFMLNLMSKLTLLAAAWAANDCDVASGRAAVRPDGSLDCPPATSAGMPGAPVPAGPHAADGVAAASSVGPPGAVVGGRADPKGPDKAALASGAVLGAAAATAYWAVATKRKPVD